MVTIKDVARVSGLSTSTVSRVIRGESNVKASSRAKIQKVIADLGYRPNINAQALVSSKSNTLGVVVPMVSMPFFGALVCGAEEAINENQYKVLISNAYGSEQKEREAIESLLQHKCGAIVFHSARTSDQKLIELAEEIPGLVFINRFISKIAHRCVWLDNNQGAQEATRYLIDKGHKDIAVISREDMNPDARARLDGIRTAAANAGVPIQDDLIELAKVAEMDGGRDAVKKLLARGKKFTAIMTYNDHMAVGVVHELQAQGIKVPEEVSVIGFDDLLISRACFPSLTTMHYPVAEMASYAANLAMELAEEPIEAGRTHLFMPHLVERGSVADLNKVTEPA
ncbi:LacI family DNA-binding transcriptional regulator [Microbulbifer agarilyticus]|uniref:LacI family DNA-binding transcriptional regulator n=1 Tax=Microbulbifer agarilyticus TaxID=260552 RepID=UPI001C953DF3|nr:LacI family DNA-binding transcriptional regulator [Microbulbifer agarilyticus]MBY6210918.1 LacI family DNA-binding transcriptional regulator [Microbulbifer agarilyticus]MCA0892144.1 LacI family DNA-binding transcriptional regulator [Microbulbifer agarilyticus]